MSVAFRIRFYGVFADSRLFAHASLDLHLYLISVHVLVRYIGGGGGDGGGGVMTSMRMRLLCCVSLVVLCFVHWWEGGGGWGHFAPDFAVVSFFPGQHCADPRLVAYASLDFHVYAFDLRAGVGRGGRCGGADDVHANAAHMYCSSLSSVD